MRKKTRNQNFVAREKLEFEHDEFKFYLQLFKLFVYV